MGISYSLVYIASIDRYTKFRARNFSNGFKITIHTSFSLCLASAKVFFTHKPYFYKCVHHESHARFFSMNKKEQNEVFLRK